MDQDQDRCGKPRFQWQITHDHLEDETFVHLRDLDAFFLESSIRKKMKNVRKYFIFS